MELEDEVKFSEEFGKWKFMLINNVWRSPRGMRL
jgi:hypothetical protein